MIRRTRNPRARLAADVIAAHLHDSDSPLPAAEARRLIAEGVAIVLGTLEAEVDTGPALAAILGPIRPADGLGPAVLN